MKRYIVFVLFILLSALTASPLLAQYENTSGKKQEGKVIKKQQKPIVRRWFTGGMIGAGFSSYSSYVEIAPIVGYKITPDFHVGTRITYIYNSYKVYTGPTTEKRINLNHYGASLFARYIFFKFLFAHVEYEALNFDYYDYTIGQHDRRWVNSLFVGGGLYQKVGGRGFMTFAVLFNLLDNQYSPYSNPIFRIGFGIGL